MTGANEKFRHDRSRYERPTLGWRCGRAALWGKPCPRGPSAFGVCGGEGAPCVPRRTFAVWRGRLSVLAAGLVLALVAVFSLNADMSTARFSSIDPGPLSPAHAHFALESGCGACHAASGKGAAGWWQAFWGNPPAPAADTANPRLVQAEHSLSASCTNCHGFGGKETLAHNRVFETRHDLAPTDCLMCHTEHKGRDAAITTLTQTQCQSCHTNVVHDFARDHPQFHPDFPYEHAQGLRFDHASHILKHFADPRVAKLAPQGGCIGCHVVGDGGRAIRPASFETSCASCHADAIAKRDFTMFRWPEIDNNAFKPVDVAAACGGEPAKADDKFSGVSADPPNALTAYLLGVGADDAADYEGPVQDLARAMLKGGADPLVAAVKKRLPGAAAEKLFAGLNPEQARRAACAWAANQEYEAPGKAELAGWRADSLELRYARPGHADPVLKAWIDAVVSAPEPADGDDKARLADTRKELLSASDGPGQCMKCHTVSGPANGPQQVNWTVTLRQADPHTRFDHRPHIDLLGPEKTCTSCHALGDAPSAATPNALKPITLNICADCHAAGKVRDDCQLCHLYHQDPALKRRMMSDAK